MLLVAALRLSTSPSGAEVENSLLKHPTSVDFLATKKKGPRSGGDGGGGDGAPGSSSSAAEEEEDLDATLPPKELAEGWVVGRLRSVMEKGRGGDVLVVEAAAWASLRVLQTVAMGPLRASTAPRVAEAFLRVLLAGLVCSCLACAFACRYELRRRTGLVLVLGSCSAAFLVLLAGRQAFHPSRLYTSATLCSAWTYTVILFFGFIRSFLSSATPEPDHAGHHAQAPVAVAPRRAAGGRRGVGARPPPGTPVGDGGASAARPRRRGASAAAPATPGPARRHLLSPSGSAGQSGACALWPWRGGREGWSPRRAGVR